MPRKQWLALAAAALGLGGLANAQEPAAPCPASALMVESANPVPPPNAGGLMGGASLYFLKPYINNNTAFVTATGIGTATPTTTSSDFDWSYHVAPAVWLGYTSDCGLGVRGRYFIFDESSSGASGSLTALEAATTSITPPAGLSPVVGTPPTGFGSPGILLQGGAGQDLLNAGSDLRLQTLDFEATYVWQADHFTLLFSG